MNALSVTPCLLCRSSQRRIVVRAPDLEYQSLPGEFEIVACIQCGHHFLDPMPAPEDVPALYADTYYTVSEQSPLHFRGLVKRMKLGTELRRTLRLAATTAPRRVLEVGCGNAQRLARLKQIWGEGVRVVGIDLAVSDQLRRDAADRGVELFEANVDEHLEPLQGETFDLIIMSQIIEHLRDPLSALRRLRTVLSARGRVLVETPNIAGVDYSLFKGRFWGGYHIPRHFHLFTRASLGNLAEQAGLRVAASGCNPSPGLWIMSLRNRLGLSSARRSKSPFELINFSNVFAVAMFTVFDLACLAVGRETSNQYAVLVHGEHVG